MNARTRADVALARRLTALGGASARGKGALGLLGIDFRPYPGQALVDDWEAAGAGARPVSGVLYVHIPFCARVCAYCLLSSSKAPPRARIEAYLEALHTQIGLMAPRVQGRRFGSLHIGGGTPSLLTAPQLDRLLGALEVFAREDGFQIGIEAHPATCTAEKVAVMRDHGVDRVSFGVETLTPAVLAAVGRSDQTEKRVVDAIEAVHRAGLRANVDMLAGLPEETPQTWERSLRQALRLGAESMSVNRFLAENSPLSAAGYGPSEAENRRADAMLLSADRLIRAEAPPRWPAEPLARAGYGTQYVWDPSEKARAYFQQDMIGPTATLALGHGALGHLPGRHFHIAAAGLDAYLGALAEGRPPPMLATPVTGRFEMAFYAADHACRAGLSPKAFRRAFGVRLSEVFGDELGFLVSEGRLDADATHFRKRPDPAFQVFHLLAFLLGEGPPAEAAGDPPDPTTAVTLGPEGIDDPVAAGQYADIRAEIPPSLLWCRLAIRASRTARAQASGAPGEREVPAP